MRRQGAARRSPPRQLDQRVERRERRAAVAAAAACRSQLQSGTRSRAVSVLPQAGHCERPRSSPAQPDGSRSTSVPTKLPTHSAEQRARTGLKGRGPGRRQPAGGRRQAVGVRRGPLARHQQRLRIGRRAGCRPPRRRVGLRHDQRQRRRAGRSERSRERSSSLTSRASSALRITRGVMKTISSVRLLAMLVRAEQVAEHRDLAQHRDAVAAALLAVLDQAAQHHGLAALDVDPAGDLALGEGRRQRVAGRCRCLVSTRLTSCAISSDTAWLELIRGRTCRMTPVSRYSMLLTMGASADRRCSAAAGSGPAPRRRRSARPRCCPGPPPRARTAP